MEQNYSRVVIVTGGSRGIGRAIALRLAKDGFSVVVNYAGNEASATAVVSAIREAGGTAIAVRANVAEPAEVENLYAEARHAFGRVDVVVNSAGVMSMAPIAENDLDSFDSMIAINLRGTYLLMAQAAQVLPDGGRFIALSSSVIAKNFPGYGPYIASKAGVEGLVRTFANELRGRNITVNAVAPGPVGTELFLAGKSDALIAQIASQSPLERLGEPDDIANAVSFLAGPDGGWINGQVLRANGGFA
ncbi:SDR family oxidoreductase [Paraburkholderia phosphatilytica]|uniref:SDR family oxidoreductase n=1 Tax=Paraburkholderia phosphatilytica TaxID=2282883 RepID=UPI000E4BDFAC|nr:SDR family oxidoreductase [Paraburkholderia phosphatilytica]